MQVCLFGSYFCYSCFDLFWGVGGRDREKRIVQCTRISLSQNMMYSMALALILQYMLCTEVHSQIYNLFKQQPIHSLYHTQKQAATNSSQKYLTVLSTEKQSFHEKNWTCFYTPVSCCSNSSSRFEHCRILTTQQRTLQRLTILWQILTNTVTV